MERIQLKQSNIEVERLNEDNLKKINGFTSDVCKELENFLKENAWEESKIDISKTYLFFHKGILAGYMTILTDKQSLKINHAGSSLLKFSKKIDDGYSSVPALKIGRMCVTDEYNSQVASSNYSGLGKIMLASVLDHAKDLKDKVGCRVIILVF